MTWVRVRAKDRVKEEYGLNTASPCIKEREREGEKRLFCLLSSSLWLVSVIVILLFSFL